METGELPTENQSKKKKSKAADREASMAVDEPAAVVTNSPTW